ncbi:MAG: hypothetical protein ACP5TL_03165 [Candidatus Micrarchaeia archaeon]
MILLQSECDADPTCVCRPCENCLRLSRKLIIRSSVAPLSASKLNQFLILEVIKLLRGIATGQFFAQWQKSAYFCTWPSPIVLRNLISKKFALFFATVESVKYYAQNFMR